MIFANKNTNIRKHICIILFVLMTFNLIGCSGKKQQLDTVDIETSNEKYMRTDIDMEEEPLTISKAEDGGVFVVTGDDKTSKAVWHIGNDNKKKKMYDLHELLGIDNNVYCKAIVKSDGVLFVEVNTEVDITRESPFGDGSLEYFIVDESGDKRNISMDLPELVPEEGHSDAGEENKDKINHIISAKCIDEYIYAVDANCNVYEVDLKNSISKCVFENNGLGYINEFYVYDRMLIMWAADEQIYFEGLDTHENEKEMGDRLTDFFQEAKYAYKSIQMDGDNGELWTLSEDRICKLNFENDKAVKYKVFGTNSNEYILEQITINGEMYALVGTYDNQVSKLYKYSISNAVSTVSDAEPQNIKIWTLDGSVTIEERVRFFTDQYPDVQVEIETGMGDFDSGLTVSDALKNLNTSLLAGEGPDIIFMDGLDINKYIQSGELYNITDLVKELEDSGEYFNNILDAFEADGNIYVIPSSVTLIGKVGTKENIKASENLREFVDYIKANSGDGSVIHRDLVTNYILCTYYKDIQESIISGEIDREILKEFFEASKELYDIAGNKERILDTLYMYDPVGYASDDGTFNFIIGNRFDVVSAHSYDEMARRINGEVELPANDYKEQYLVRDCIAISSKSSNIEMAKEFIRVTLGEECQESITGAVGFRVNKKALVDYSRYVHETLMQSREGTEINIEAENQALENRIEEVVNHLEKVSKPIHIDKLLDQIVLDEMNNYIFNNKDRDAAIDSALEKIKLYMAE